MSGTTGTPSEKLSLKPGTDTSVYRVIKKIPNIERAKVVPWFGMPSGGI
ncbi:glycohydrolase toxin TNT-related protein [Lactiplantibacillus plantarum]|nr:glycohydrolase toxin TNT-related protein [Lactiplantibacillus plantarum]QXN29290.1 TNT domain-containing protein [Lactiplantibacillus plantarum subsp. plantarum]MBO2710498.1 glycohydrolase toxin TNT-related protein [Lactiplantibacillus plantarum]MBS0939645.1 glycohydrolase toxin TNT-related protein [Lactiplantibacillus plantarum]MBS0955082.1 glycohydrolase toxin TNT-related protein [Lactiplantibacillus plantarum]